ncbi:uncharacterized protein LOC128229604 [Mya arenaria]|uniref:uncharacterized protein LOC128229604 n=1 Tax=Mya arenaria TaxID=6604 RepID=UPI0022DEFDBA|nr:uncharacterized protein LOC128229604 [Mya arenaria]XP_052797322.1 uncharacterized protein LOC128229604 [Mya arenaria]
MKLLLVSLLLVGVVHANILDTLSGVVDTVGGGVKDAANTVAGAAVDAANVVGHGVQDAAHAVAGALPDIGSAIGSTFGDIWQVAKDPLKEAGKELLIQAGEFALHEGLTLALDALASGKRETVNPADVRAFLTTSLLDEFDQWLRDTETQVLGSRTELTKAMGKLTFHRLPSDLRQYVSEYATARASGTMDKFIMNQASKISTDAIAVLKTRLTDRIHAAISSVVNVHQQA